VAYFTYLTSFAYMKQLEKKKGHASKENTKTELKESITPFLNAML